MQPPIHNGCVTRSLGMRIYIPTPETTYDLSSAHICGMNLGAIIKILKLLLQSLHSPTKRKDGAEATRKR